MIFGYDSRIVDKKTKGLVPVGHPIGGLSLSLFVFGASSRRISTKESNGWFVDQMISNGYYSYDPTNYHGPFHFYILWVFKFFLGRNLWGLRLSASVFGLAGIYLVTQLKPYVGKFTAYASALFLAVSPGMTFYTRYAIHESELFFFMILTLLGFFRLMERKDKRSIWEIGLWNYRDDHHERNVRHPFGMFRLGFSMFESLRSHFQATPSREGEGRVDGYRSTVHNG